MAATMLVVVSFFGPFMTRSHPTTYCPSPASSQAISLLKYRYRLETNLKVGDLDALAHGKDVAGRGDAVDHHPEVACVEVAKLVCRAFVQARRILTEPCDGA